MDDEKCYCVYKHVNKVNGKVYVGITNNVSIRWRGEGEGYKGCTAFYGAIKKYGWESFEHTIIINDLTFDEACEKEKYYIALYKSNCHRYYHPSYGYNMTDGGEGSVGSPLTEEAKKKIRDAMDSKSHEELIGIYAKRGRTWSETNKGRKMSEKCREVLSNSRKGCIGGNAKPVLCVNDNKYFRSCQEAAEYYGIYDFQVKSVCNYSSRSINNLDFRYATKIEAFDYFDISKKPVMCIESGKIYDSAEDASKDVSSELDEKLVKRGIIRCCKGYRPSAYSYHWRFVEKEEYIEWASVNYAKSNDIRKKELDKNRRWNYRGKPVICLNDGNYFDSIKVASVFYGLSVSMVTKSASEHRKTTSGFEFRYLSDSEIIEYGIDVGSRCKPVICIETGVYYDNCQSIGEYSKHIYDAVYKCCNGKQKTSLGFHWRFATPDEIKEKYSERG